MNNILNSQALATIIDLRKHKRKLIKKLWKEIKDKKKDRRYKGRYEGEEGSKLLIEQFKKIIGKYNRCLMKFLNTSIPIFNDSLDEEELCNVLNKYD